MKSQWRLIKHFHSASESHNAVYLVLPPAIRFVSSAPVRVWNVVCRVPVDYMSLGLTDYPEVVKEPMDISTIRKNMFEDHYSEDPWKFIQHMQLMFSNAWLYNRKATKIYKNTTRVRCLYKSNVAITMGHSSIT